MIYLMMNDATYRQVPDAESALVLADQVVCFRNDGTIVETFTASKVTAFGRHPALKEPKASHTGAPKSANLSVGDRATPDGL